MEKLKFTITFSILMIEDDRESLGTEFKGDKFYLDK